MAPIEQCSTCVKLEQRIELDFKNGDVRPATLDALVTLGKRSGASDEATENWTWSELALRCPTCGTIYTAYHSEDPGHSFMDPTHDTESINRRTPHVARAYLGNFETPEAAVAADELGAREGQLLDELTTMLNTPGRAPNWQVQRYAIESLLDACTAARDLERLERVLLRHEDPVVRVDAASALVDELYSPRSWRADFALQALPGHVVPCLAGVLAAPNRQTWKFSSPRYNETTTHAAAANAVGTAVHHDVPIDDALVDRLTQLLRVDRWPAQHALISVLLKSPARARRLLPGLQALPFPQYDQPSWDNFLAIAQQEAAKAVG